MKIHKLDAHDRLQHFVKQDFSISECVQDLINQRPFGEYPFYIFAHARTLGIDEKYKLFFLSGKYSNIEDVPEKTIIWQPRLTRPEPQTNSMLFKGYPGTDIVKIMWILPPEELWKQYKKGQLTENSIVMESIDKFLNRPQELRQREDDDLSEEKIDAIYQEISLNASKHNLLKQLYT